ncbi:hypothetical protein B0H11DRAFT_2221245 [Mycena galericulata]|nr:hypothetical protein B0H11DRAFT_2221245 [Mycena galericulata]
MTGLTELYLDCEVDASALLRFMWAPLVAFRYAFLTAMPLDIYRFLYLQPTIRNLSLCRGIPYEIDPPPFLPNIRILHARPLDLEQLLRNRPVAEVHLRYRYYDIGFRSRTHLAFILESGVPVQRLHAMACQFVDHADLFPYIPNVNHLVISAYFSWGRNDPSVPAPEYPQLMIDLCKKFSNLVALRHLAIITFFCNDAVRIFYGRSARPLSAPPGRSRLPYGTPLPDVAVPVFWNTLDTPCWTPHSPAIVIDSKPQSPAQPRRLDPLSIHSFDFQTSGDTHIL